MSAPPSSPTPRRLRRAAAGLLVAFGILAVVEGGLRLRYRADELLFSYERPGALVTVSDGVLFPQPDVSLRYTDGPYSWSADHNASGFRESAPTPTRAPRGKRRLLALGDSWIYGFSVTQGRTIADRVEARLPDTEVINAGVFGSSAFDTLRRYTDLVDELHPDGIVVGLPHNQRRQAHLASVRERYYAAPAARVTSHLRVYLLARWWLTKLRAPRYATPPEDLQPEIADLLSLAGDAQARGLPVYFLLLPTKYGGVPGGSPWVESLGPVGVQFAGHALPDRACWGFEDLAHPSEAGADAIAATLVALLQGGPSLTAPAYTPTCAESEGVGPGKDGWPAG